MLIRVNTFTIESEEATFRKIFEELSELAEARAIARESDKCFEHMKAEVGDLLTAIANWCEWVGVDPQECVDIVETSNRSRGRYL